MQAESGAPGGAAEPSVWRRFGASVLLLVTGSLVTLAMFQALRAAEINDSERQFAAWTGERRDLLQKEVDGGLHILLGVRALFDSSEFVSAQEFDRYTAELITRYPHIFSLEWLPRVDGKRRAEFEKSASEALGTDYRIRQRNADTEIVPAAQRSEYFPIFYVQAHDGLARLGLDAGARAANLRAIQIAARSNRLSASRVNIAKVGDEAVERVFVFLPVFDRPSGALAGFVRTSISVDEMLKATMRQSLEEGIAVELVDPADRHVLGRTDEVAAEDVLEPGSARSMSWRGDLQIADLELDLNFHTTDKYLGYARLAPLYMLLFAGLCASALGAFAAYNLTRRRLRLQVVTDQLMTEVNERRHSEQRLSQSEARYRVLVENSPDAIALHHNGHIVFANAACARLLGARTPEEVVGKTVFDIVDPKYHEQVRTRLAAMAESKVILPPVEMELVSSDGSRVEVEILAVPFDTDEGVVIQVTGRDITQRKATEAERQKLEAALRHSQKLEALGTLAGGIAHDFNNILSAIIGNARLLFEDLPKSHVAARSVREILNAAHRARDLVKRVTAFSSQQESLRTSVPVAPLVFEVRQMLRATLPAGIELVVQVPGETPAVLGDATQIHQVLMNLCTNAWQAMSDRTGRIEISVSTVEATEARARLATPLSGASRFVCFAVHDNGSGIAPDIIEHIFEPFFTTKGPGEGTGLGLAVAHGIVQSHKGAIAVESRPGQGTTFFMYLPAAAAPTPTPAQMPRPKARGGKQHVLYIDDEEPLVFLVVRTLERAGYQCTGTQDAAEAIELVRQSPASFDLVVTDLNMPGMSGLDVSREVLAARPDMPIIITTGYIRADDVAAARKLGVRDVVLKPDTIEGLAATVEAHLARVSVEER